MLSPARVQAFDILLLVEAGGYAGELLHSRGDALSPRDAALASELVMGVLRRRAQLDHLIRHYSGRPAEGMDAEVRIALRIGMYQLRFLDRVPSHAAVSESVGLVKRARKSSAAGLANAVLRKVGREEIPWPDRATRMSLPPWLWEAWVRQFGEEVAAGIGNSFLQPPLHYLRVPPGREGEARALGAIPASEPGCYVLPQGSPAATVPFRQQDISSQAIVPLLDLRPGMRLLDLCAAPGNKTAQALEAGVRVVACDLHPRRLQSLAGIGCERVALDASKPLPFRGKFDRILVDAPCSGTGTLGRNPEIRWRVQPKDLARLGRRQVELLANSLKWLDSKGKLVYSTCSLEREENEDVVSEALAASGERVQLVRTMRRTPGVEPGDGFFAAMITSR